MSGPAPVLPLDVWPVVLERLVAVAKRGMRPVTVIVLRGDELEPDDVAGQSRDSDSVGQLADGGIVVICPDTPQNGGVEFANRLMAERDGVAAGVATVPMSALDAEELLVAAIDAARSGTAGIASAPGLD